MFGKIKRALGFDDDEDDVIVDDPGTEAESLTQGKTATPATSSGVVNQTMEDGEAVEKIFEHVVRVFDDALPGFLKAGANEQAQRHFLYESLSGDVREYLSALSARAEADCERRWQSDREALQEKLRAVELRAKEVEEKRLDLSQRQLSAERQKRALTERVQELERQLSKIDADREQYDLENKSLVNKLKVAGVYEKENEDLRAALSDAQAELLTLRKGVTTTAQGSETASKELAEARRVLGERDEALRDAEIRIKTLEANLSDVTKAREAAEHEALEMGVKAETLEADKTGIAKELETLRGELSQAESEVKSLRAQGESLRAQVKELETSAHETAAVDITADELEELRCRAKEAEEIKREFADIETQFARFKNIKENKDRKIAGLKSELAAAQACIATLESVVDSTRGGEDAKKAKDERGKDISESGRTRRRARRDDVPIDDILNDTDWLVSPPTGESRSSRRGEGRESHSRVKDNDSQLSLFGD